MWISFETSHSRRHAVRSRLAMLFALLSCLACVSAWAAPEFCNPLFGPTRFVGDKASDSNCTDDDIQSAIQATIDNGSVCPAKIFITREHLYSNQALTISNSGKNITLIGQGDGVPCGTNDSGICIGDSCPPPPTGPLVTIRGHDGDSVFHIDGANDITLRYLNVTGGSVGGTQRGGGVYFDGTGSLTIDTSTINFNSAGYGGGIDFTGDGGNATLRLGSYALVLSNNALSGGGIRVAGSARMFALNASALIAYNHANGGTGGGLEIVGPARADLGAAGYGGLPLVYLNTANYGGGIGVENGGTVRLFATDPAAPVSVSSNSADATGGGIFLGAGDTGNVACLNSFKMNDNIAQEGAAIYGDAGARIGINAAPVIGSGTDPCSLPEDQATLGALACARGVTCNQFNGNVAEDASANPTDGATILAQSNALLVANRFSATKNRGGHVIRSVADDVESLAFLYNCLLADNTLTHEVFAMTEGGNFGDQGLIASCTIVGNTISSVLTKVIKADHAFSLSDSIIYQPGLQTVDFQGEVFNAEYVLSNDLQTLPARVENALGVPLFADAAHGDYHQLPTSPGVDFAPARGGQDLDGFSRAYNLPAVDRFGPMDVGAYELHSACAASDTIFCDGFE